MATGQKLVTQNLTKANRKGLMMTILTQRMIMVSPGMYGCHQFTAVEQWQMAYLKQQTRPQIFNCPLDPIFL